MTRTPGNYGNLSRRIGVALEPGLSRQWCRLGVPNSAGGFPVGDITQARSPLCVIWARQTDLPWWILKR